MLIVGGIVNILVTGGAGFIGSNFVHYLVGLGLTNLKIVILDNLTYASNLTNLEGLNQKVVELVIGDIRDKGLVEKIFPAIDYLVHFAAESHVDNSIKSPEKFVSTNVLGTQVLLDAARKFNIKKFLYVSTDEIYGSIQSGSFTESDNYNPSSPYSASKAAAEMLVLAYGTTYGLKYNISRCSNNYGPRQHNEKLIPNFIDLLNSLKPVNLYGNGLNIRDWIYVDDHCEALYKILLSGRDRQIYNVSGTEEFSNLEITRKLLDLVGLDDGFINFVNDRPGHDFRYSISADKIANELNFQPKTKFNDGLKKTLLWYLNSSPELKSPIANTKQVVDFNQF